VEVKVGDTYIRHSDGRIYRVKWIGDITAVLESEDGILLRLTDIFDLEKAYSKKESKPTEKSP